MNKLFFAAVGVSALFSGAAAFAQGLPVGTFPQTFGAVWDAPVPTDHNLKIYDQNPGSARIHPGRQHPQQVHGASFNFQPATATAKAPSV